MDPDVDSTHEVRIRVRGHADRAYAPELATVRLRVRVVGDDRRSAYDPAVALLAEISESLAALQADGAVLRWSAARLNVASHRRRKGGSTRHQATAWVKATFTDTDGLTGAIDEWAVRDGVQVDSIDWDLAEDSRAAYATEARVVAVGDALERARAYADALGLADLEVVAVTDVDDGIGWQGQSRAAVFSAVDDDEPPRLTLEPSDVTVQASIQMRVVARRAAGEDTSG